MDGEACWATVHGVAKSWTQLSDFTSLHLEVAALYNHPPKPPPPLSSPVLLELTFSAISLSVCRDLGQGNFIFISEVRRLRMKGFTVNCLRSLEKEMATHPSILSWRISGTEEPGGVAQSQTRLKA